MNVLKMNNNKFTIYFLIFFYLLVSFESNSQGYEGGVITYKISFRKKLINKNNNDNKEGIEGANMLISNSKNVYGKLDFNTNESSYKLKNKLKIDGVESINITYFLAGGKDVFYYNLDLILDDGVDTVFTLKEFMAFSDRLKFIDAVRLLTESE